MNELEEYRVTFGQRYRREVHPDWAGAHPDGWLAIRAASERDARTILHGWIGGAYAFIYPPDSSQYPDTDWFPLGCLLTLGPDGEVAE